ncbi:hypothetical protein J6590_082963 [Homalodisca vitripennis]|nr:hypothetical protein J6590_088832 [Homalodisca vitripennis]KAG8299569.1 hypothetical protein J6590_097751 [Homalodisca vitripennis]KAG8309556.1 hypothetical protein J6590_082963 [Homalodisca vitripennis]
MRALGRTGRKRRVGRQSDYLRKRTFQQILRVGDVGSVPSGVLHYQPNHQYLSVELVTQSVRLYTLNPFLSNDLNLPLSSCANNKPQEQQKKDDPVTGANLLSKILNLRTTRKMPNAFSTTFRARLKRQLKIFSLSFPCILSRELSLFEEGKLRHQ